MSTLRNRLILLSSLFLVVCAPSAHAQWAVIDVGAIAQLVQQVSTMQEQLTTARDHLEQARRDFDSMTGGRGMENLLSGINRNYLPSTWSELESALTGAAGAYGALSASLQSVMDANAVLSTRQVGALSAKERAQLEAARRSTATLQVTAREALAAASQRFTSIQQLINAIPGAGDQKAILDLQARIAAEQGMLQNEQTKLDTLERLAQAEERARQQRLREQAIADIGSFRDLPPMGLL